MMAAYGVGAFAIALLAAGASPPQSPPAPQTATGQSAPATHREEVVVTATRLEQLVKDVPAAVTIVTREDIRRSGATTVDEVLRMVAGFSQLRQASSHASHPTTRSAAVRGLGGSTNSRTLVLLDGVPLNEPFAGAVYWSRVPVESIERIEIVKSGASGVWGNLALGGVIHIITKSPGTSGPAVGVTVDGGSRGTANLSAVVRGARGKTSASVAAHYFRTEGYFAIHPDQAGPIDGPLADATRTVDAKLEYQASPDVVWSVGGSFYSEDYNGGTPLAASTVQAGAVRGGGTFVTAGGSRWQALGIVTRQTNTAVQPTVAADRRSEIVSNNQFDIPATAVAANVQWSRPFGTRHLVSAGSDVQWISAAMNEDYNAVGGQLRSRRATRGRQLLNGAYLQDIFQVNPRWRIVAAVRLDRWVSFDGARLESDIASGNTLREVEYASYRQWAVDPSIGVVHHLSPRVSVRGTAYRGFRAPTQAELYRPFRARGNVITESNALLDPERLTGVEGSVDASIARGARARITAFWDRLDDPITNRTIAVAGATGRTIAPCGFVPAGGVCRQRANFGRLQSRGIESELEFELGTAWTFSVDYLFNSSRIVEADEPDLVGLFNKHSPVHQVAFTTRYDNLRVVSVSLSVRSMGQRYEDDVNSLRISAFTVADFRVSRPVTSAFEAFLSIENLFDRTYVVGRATDGTSTVGAPRLLRAGLRMRF